MSNSKLVPESKSYTLHSKRTALFVSIFVFNLEERKNRGNVNKFKWSSFFQQISSLVNPIQTTVRRGKVRLNRSYFFNKLQNCTTLYWNLCGNNLLLHVFVLEICCLLHNRILTCKHVFPNDFEFPCFSSQNWVFIEIFFHF